MRICNAHFPLPRADMYRLEATCLVVADLVADLVAELVADRTLRDKHSTGA